MSNSQYILHHSGVKGMKWGKHLYNNTYVTSDAGAGSSEDRKHNAMVDRVKEAANNGSKTLRKKKTVSLRNAFVQTNHTAGTKPSDAQRTGEEQRYSLSNLNWYSQRDHSGSTSAGKEKEYNKPKGTFGKARVVFGKPKSLRKR